MASGKTYKYVLSLKDKMSRTMAKVSKKGGKAYSRLNRMQGRLNKLTAKFGGISSRVFGAIGVASVGLFTKKMIDVTKKTAAAGDEASKTARQYGMTAEALQELRFAADRQGVAASKMDSSLQALSKRAGELRTNTGALYTYLNKTGNKALMEQLKAAKNTEEAFRVATKALNNTTDANERAALSSAMFSRAGMEMVKMTEAGNDGIMKLRKEAREYGEVISNEAAKRAEKFVDVQRNMQATMTGLRNVIGVELMPIVQKYMKQITTWIKKHKDLIATKIKSFIEGVANTISWLVRNMNWLLPTIKLVVGAMIALKVATLALNFAMMAGPWGWILAAVAAVVLAIVVLIRNWDKVAATMIGLWEVIKNFGVALYEWLITPIQLMKGYLVGLAKVMKAVFQRDFKKAAEIGKNTFSGLKAEIQKDIETIKKTAASSGDTFRTAYQAEMQKRQKNLEKGAKIKTSIEPPKKPKGDLGYSSTVIAEASGDLDTALSTGIMAGGSKQTNVNISLENLVENINISREGFEAAAEDMTEQVRAALLKVLNSANRLANG